jgi:uncharacterized C2H2 Zn-finger protein
MTALKSKYAIGEIVYEASTTTVRKQHDCPDCLGTKKWKAQSPGGGEYEFSCPRCGGGFHSRDDLSLDYTRHVGTVNQLTIGSIRIDTARKDPVDYMCRETGVGSGSIYSEDRLFQTREEAARHANYLAAANDVQIEWVAKLYDKTLEVADYRLENAALKKATGLHNKATTRIGWLFEDLRACLTIEEVRHAIERHAERESA